VTLTRGKYITAIITCALALAADTAWLAHTFLSPHVNLTCQNGSRVAFSPAPGPPEWLVIAACVLGAVLLAVIMLLPEAARNLGGDQ
jgi:hypothetical protein